MINKKEMKLVEYREGEYVIEASNWEKPFFCWHKRYFYDLTDMFYQWSEDSDYLRDCIGTKEQCIRWLDAMTGKEKVKRRREKWNKIKEKVKKIFNKE